MADYNTEWSKLNNIPLNTKWDAAGQTAYINQLTTANPTQYKVPDMTGATTTPAPSTGLMSPTSPAGTYTFENQAQDRYGITSPTTSSPAVPSATSSMTSNAPAGQPDTSLSSLADQQRNTPVSQTATNFTGQEPYGTGTGPNGSYTFDDQARDRYGAANTNEWTANMANAQPDLGAPSPWADPQASLAEINRRLALRGLPPQNASGGTTGTGGTSGSTTGLMSGPNTVDPVTGKVGYEARQLADPTKWNVDDNQTVAGQVRNLINENNPLQQQAATRAKQQMNQSGLLNSSMAVQAGQAAMYDAALPIAQADAGTFGRAAAYNADTENQFAGKNVDASNAAFKSNADTVAATARDTAATIAQANLTDKQGNISAEAASKLAGVNAQTAAKLAETNAAAAVLQAQNEIDIAAAGAVNDTALTNLKANLARASMGQEQTALMSRELTSTINSINMNPNLNAEGKTAQINEAVRAANMTFEAIHKVTQLTGNVLEFTQEEQPPPPSTTTPTPTSPPNSTSTPPPPRDFSNYGGV